MCAAYDDAWIASGYVVLSVLLPVTVCYTYASYARGVVNVPACKCCICKSRKRKQQSWRGSEVWVIGMLWAITSTIAYFVCARRIEFKNGVFDPFQVLRIDQGASFDEIKAAFRKEVLREKRNGGERMEEVVRAWNVLKDSHRTDLGMESRGVEALAIPSIVVRYGGASILVYVLIFGVSLPVWVVMRWASISSKNIFGVRFSTVDTFYKQYDSKNGNIRKILETISSSQDFRGHSWKGKECRVSDVALIIESTYGVPIRKRDIGHLILTDHIFRTGKSSVSDLDFVQRTSIAILKSIREISLEKDDLNFITSVFDVERMIVQAVFDPSYKLMQLPEISFEKIFLQNKSIGMRTSRSTAVNDVEWFEAPKSAICLPSAEIVDLSLLVDGAKSEGEDGVDGNRLFVIPRCSEISMYVKIRTHPGSLSPYVHAPFIVTPIKMEWAVFVVADGRILGEIITLPDTAEKTLSFNFSPDQSILSSNVSVFVKTGCYFDVDKEMDATIQYVKACE